MNDIRDHRHSRPLVSIVTPAFNCAEYLEETILSVRSQNYPHIEHVVVDGGSQDGSIDILKKYDGQIKWISEPDNGMYDAINKGFVMAEGDILSYINADDLYYAKDSISLVVNEFEKNISIDFTYGHCAFMDVSGKILYTYKAPPFNRKVALALPRIIFHQPTCFWRKRVHVGFDSSLRYCGDSKFFRHLCKDNVGKNTNHTIAKFRVREDCISFMNREKMAKEDEHVFGVLAERKPPLYLILLDLVYIRTFLNLGANFKRFILYCQKKPYL